MALALLHGDDGARGAMTTGGTESIFLAVKAARDQARQRGSGMRHAADRDGRQRAPGLRQGGALHGLKPVRTPLRADFRADPAAIAAAITPTP